MDRKFLLGKPPFIVVLNEDGIHTFGGLSQFALIAAPIPFLALILITNFLSAFRVISLNSAIPYMVVELVIMIVVEICWIRFYTRRVRSNFPKGEITLEKLERSELRKKYWAWSQVTRGSFDDINRLDVSIGSGPATRTIFAHYSGYDVMQLKLFLSQKLANRFKG